MLIRNSKKQLIAWRSVATTLLLSAPYIVMAQTTLCNLLVPFNNIAKLVSYLVGAIAIVMLLWSAFLFITGGGNEEQLKKAKSYLLYALIGIAVAVLANNAERIVQSIIGGNALETQCPNLR